MNPSDADILKLSIAVGGFILTLAGVVFVIIRLYIAQLARGQKTLFAYRNRDETRLTNVEKWIIARDAAAAPQFMPAADDDFDRTVQVK